MGRAFAQRADAFIAFVIPCLAIWGAIAKSNFWGVQKQAMLVFKSPFIRLWSECLAAFLVL